MKLTAIILFSACVTASAKGFSQNVSFSGKEVNLKKVFTAIERQTNFVFFYDAELLNNAKPVTIDAKNVSVQSLLSEALMDQGLDYVIKQQTIFITQKARAFTAPVKEEAGISPPLIEIHGRIVNENGEPVVGASVQVKGDKTKGTSTNSNGEFTLIGVEENATLIISGVNIENFEVKVKSRTDLATLTATTKVTEAEGVEVTVNKGYYTTTQKLNTGDVTKITSKDIEKQPVSNVLAALEGRVPGLVITQTTGAPGGGFTFQIRGQNSINNGNDPFFVVDGVPYPSQTLGLLNGVLKGGNPLNYLNPSDIENVEVLKDADATSIYGSRAANGAILITTKKGKAGKMRVDVNAYAGIGKVTREAKLLNTQQYLQMRHEGFYNDSIARPTARIRPTISNAPDLLVWDTTRYTDWQKVLIGNSAHYSDALASVSGGTTNIQYLLSGDYHRETTVYPSLLSGQGDDQRASLYFNLLTISDNKKLKINLGSSYVSDLNRVQPNDFNGSAFLLPPDAPAIFNPDGTLNWAPSTAGQRGTWSNPFALLYQKYRGRTSNIVGNAFISYNLLPGLEIKTSLGYTNTQTDGVWTAPTTIFDPATPNLGSQAYSQFSITNTHSWIVEPQADYQLNLGKAGTLSALAGMTFQANNTDAKSIYAQGFISDALLENIGSASTLSQTSSGAEYKYNAVFGRLNYNLQDKYILNVTGRRDGSSRFGPGKQFANFGSIGAAWIFSGEDFFKQKLPFISFGKLRASYGTSGNDQIGDYTFLDLYTPTSYPYQGIQTIYPQNLFNSQLAWELDKKLEVGFDLGFFKDRVLFNASYFRNRSGNQLMSTPLSVVTGFGSIPFNLPAVVQNTGLEIVLNTVNIRNKNFSWRTSFNISIPQNKLVSFPDLANSPFANTLIVGKSIGIKKVYHFIGVNDTTGIYQFATSHGTPTYSPVFNIDNTVVINTAPKFYGGLQNSFQFKGFSLDFLFQFVKQTGANIFASMSTFPGYKANQPSIVMDHWQKPGDKSAFQQFTQTPSGNVYRAFVNSRNSDFAYSDASFIRIKNLSLSYVIPANWQKRMHMQNLRVYIQGQNLLTITNYKGNDPESQGIGLPPLRVWTAGFQISL